MKLNKAKVEAAVKDQINFAMIEAGMDIEYEIGEIALHEQKRTVAVIFNLQVNEEHNYVGIEKV